MKRRAFLVGHCRAARRGSRAGSILRRPAGGGVVALVDRRPRVAPRRRRRELGSRPRSGSRLRRGHAASRANGFGQALVAHTAPGAARHRRRRPLDGRRGESAGLGEPRYTAMHPAETLAYVSDSRRRSGSRRRPRASHGRRAGSRPRPGAPPFVQPGRQAALGRARQEGDARRGARRPPYPSRPALPHDASRRFSRTTSVWAPGDEQVWVTSGSAARGRGLRREWAEAGCVCPRAAAAAPRVPRLARLRDERRRRHRRVHRLDGTAGGGRHRSGRLVQRLVERRRRRASGGGSASPRRSTAAPSACSRPPARCVSSGASPARRTTRASSRRADGRADDHRGGGSR